MIVKPFGIDGIDKFVHNLFIRHRRYFHIKIIQDALQQPGYKQHISHTHL